MFVSLHRYSSSSASCCCFFYCIMSRMEIILYGSIEPFTKAVLNSHRVMTNSKDMLHSSLLILGSFTLYQNEELQIRRKKNTCVFWSLFLFLKKILYKYVTIFGFFASHFTIFGQKEIERTRKNSSSTLIVIRQYGIYSYLRIVYTRKKRLRWFRIA